MQAAQEKRLIGAVIFLILPVLGWAQPEEPISIRISSGELARRDSLVCCRLPESLELGPDLVVVRTDDDVSIPAQRSQIDPQLLCWMLDKPLPPGATRDYRLATAQPLALKLRCEDRDGKLEISSSGRPILTYHQRTLMPPPPMPEYYQRSGFIHPLQTPSGRMVTDDFPPDHPHQHGVFRAWVDTMFVDQKVDFWNQQGRTGDVRHKSLERISSGPVFAEFAIQLEHIAYRPGQPPVVVLDEQWVVRSHQRGERFVVDLFSRQRAATDSPLKINEYHYGGLAIRGNRDWDAESGFDFVTSEGLGREQGNHSRPNWVMMPGEVRGAEVFSIAMGHPTNFRHPQPVRLHPSMPYYCFAPMVLGEFSIGKDQPHEARFRLFTGDGTISADEIDRLWSDYAQPITAELLTSDRD